MNNKYYNKEQEDKIISACKTFPSMRQACASLKMNHNTFRAHAKRLGVFTTNQSGKGIIKGFCKTRGYKLEDIIYNNKYPQYGTSKLTKRLIKEGIKEHRCEECEKTKWLGKPIPIETHEFTPEGTYLVKLTVTDSEGNVDYAFKSIVVTTE